MSEVLIKAEVTKRGVVSKSLHDAADAVDSGDVEKIAVHLGRALLSLSDSYLEEVFCADGNTGRQQGGRQFSTAVLTRLAHYGICLAIDARCYGNRETVQ